MLDEKLRTAIFKLDEAGHGRRAIARALKISRATVRKVLASGTSQVPGLQRAEEAEAYHDDIVEWLARCQGNWVRVHEELLAQGAKLSYPALTAYARRHGIGHEEPQRAGRYVHEPGVEMQHDTSPHPAHLGGRLQQVQIAGLALAYSRLSYIQLYPRFTRFECKVFLDDALDYVGGVCNTCMVDNTSVIVLSGTGSTMVPAAEMASFAEQRDFTFVAHEKGDANRSAVVEGLFNYTQNNFLAGRKFKDFDDANEQAMVWCDRINAKFSNKLHASRRELFAKEQAHLKPLPIWRSPVYRLHHRIVDLEGYVRVNSFYYSVSARYIGRQLEARETKREVIIFDGPRIVATHTRKHDGPRRNCLPEHRRQRRQRCQQQLCAEERQLRARLPEFDSYITALCLRSKRGKAVTNLRHLRRMLCEYPQEPFLEALRTAVCYGLYDLNRVETMTLKNIRRDFFPSAGDSQKV